MSNAFTPQNSLLDLYVIFRFLGVTFEGVDYLTIYQRKIYKKGQKGPITCPNAQRILDVSLFMDPRRLGINEVSYLQTIWDNFVIIRKKIDPETGKPLVKLPKRTDTVVLVTLTPDERKVYDHVMKIGKSTFAKIMRRRQGDSV